MSRQARLEIDWTGCDGHGLCARLWPEQIGQDPWGFPVFDPEIADEDVPRARRVAGVCPVLALQVSARR